MAGNASRATVLALRGAGDRVRAWYTRDECGRWDRRPGAIGDNVVGHVPLP
jgi:hypothetical protein